MEDNRSAIWGGATIGLVVGLILGFFVGSYWMTVLYAVLIGAATGVASNVLAGTANVLAWTASRRRSRRRPKLDPEWKANFDRKQLQTAEEGLRQYSPADFDTNPATAAESVILVHYIEDRGWWRVAYDSLESFYAAHEERHPDIRVYASVYREAPFEDPEDADPNIPQRIAEHRGCGAVPDAP